MSAPDILIYAASGVEWRRDALARARQRLRALGHDVTLDPSVRARHQRFAGNDETRLATLHRVADAAPSIAMACRGGYGLTRLLDAIDWSRIARSVEAGTRWVGYSDLTVLQMGLLAHAKAPSWAGPLAIADFGGKVLGKPIELVVADTQNKADITAAKAREWFDTQKVDMLGDVAATAPALAALQVAKQKNKIALFPSAASSRLSNEDCSAVSVHWTYDTYALAAGTGRGVVKSGGDSWFFLTADYAFGTNLEKDTTEVIKAEGGKVIGSVRHPLNASDFSSFLLQAQSSKAKIVGLANAGGDMINSIKAANEFGITKTQRLAALLVFINDIHSMGLPVAQGMLLTEAFYWDSNEETRKWSRRFFEQHKRMPKIGRASCRERVSSPV